ncbi:MAG: hypothetical protein JWN04_6315 [Myxococcaceae bacterium]|nr:hypothetical protein [Myxococcaceae bacterium]
MIARAVTKIRKPMAAPSATWMRVRRAASTRRWHETARSCARPGTARCPPTRRATMRQLPCSSPAWMPAQRTQQLPPESSKTQAPTAMPGMPAVPTMSGILAHLPVRTGPLRPPVIGAATPTAVSRSAHAARPVRPPSSASGCATTSSTRLASTRASPRERQTRSISSSPSQPAWQTTVAQSANHRELASGSPGRTFWLCCSSDAAKECRPPPLATK